MTIEEIYIVSQIIAAVAVVGSLLYLAIQVRQSARHSKAAMEHSRNQSAGEFNLRLTDRNLAAVVLRGSRGDESMDEVERFQFISFARSLFDRHRDTFFQHKHGFIHDETFVASKAVATAVLAMPGYRAVWRMTRGRQPVEYADFIDRLVKNAMPDQTIDHPAPARWATLVAEEKRLQTGEGAPPSHP